MLPFRKPLLLFLGSLCLLARGLAASVPTTEFDYTQNPKPLRNIWNSTGFSPADIVATREMQESFATKANSRPVAFNTPDRTIC